MGHSSISGAASASLSSAPHRCQFDGLGLI